ncbi:MAG: RNA binding protein snu13 [Bathelium mastoideum]|nr:MAG: RNA binding protein snu13 [Bathelium mastoideum]
MANTSAAWPFAGQALSQEILDVVQQAQNYRQLTKGIKEAAKTLNRGTSELIVIAADVSPPDIILRLPLLCEEKNVPYVYVGSQMALRRTAGASHRPVAVSITTNESSDLMSQIRSLRDKVEYLEV